MSRFATPSTDARHVVWPTTAFYWSEIDATALSSRPTDRELAYLLETDLPAPLESVHAVFTRLDATRFAACAVEKDRLRAELPADALSLRPEEPPEFLAGRLDCSRLNLLVGPWEPHAVRRMRRAWLAVAVTGLMLCAAAVSWGLQRRIGAERDHALAVGALRREVLLAAIGPAGLQPNADMALASELSRLRATRTAPPSAAAASRAGQAGDGAAVDAASVLSTVLAAWPSDVHLQTESLVVSGGTVTIAGLVPASADAQRVADALGRIAADGGAGASGRWRLDQPRFETRREGVSVTLRMHREGDPS